MPRLAQSFGISDEYSFENALATKYGCETHGYDPTVAEDPAHRFHFHKLGLSNRPGELRGVGPVVDFATIVRDTGGTGRRVAIWKSDIEGSEFPAVRGIGPRQHISFLLSSRIPPRICMRGSCSR